jgi:CheY-like chemotaxis protein
VNVLTHKPKTILVVDDDPVIREMMVDILDLEGYAVDVARNGQEALNRIEDLQHKGCDSGYLIFLDLIMPVMDGPTFYRELMAHPEWRAQQVIVIMSALDHLAQMNLPDVNMIIHKPFGVDDILNIIQQYID